MTSQEFKKIKKILKFVWQNKYSDFYRRKYGKNGLNPVSAVKSPRDFEGLPFLSREELVLAPLKKRAFLPLTKIDYFKHSSGTTGTPLMVWHTLSESFPRTKILTSHLRKLYRRIRKILVLRNEHMVPFEYIFLRKLNKLALVASAKNLALVAKIIAETEPEAIIASVRHMFLLSQLLKAEKELLFKVRLIRPLGERLNIVQHLALKRYFPKARLLRHYSGTEFDSVAVQCLNLTADPKNYNLYHLEPYVFGEIVNGELAITDLEKHPSPLVRYRTGDLALLQKGLCSCGKGRLVRIFGRKKFVLLSLDGKQFLRDDIEKALLPCARYLTGNIIVKSEQGLINVICEQETGVSKSVLKYAGNLIKNKLGDAAKNVQLQFVENLPSPREKLTETIIIG